MVEIVKNTLIKNLKWIGETPTLALHKNNLKAAWLLGLIIKYAEKNASILPHSLSINHRNRLGFFAEEILAFALEAHPHFRVLGKGIQLKDDKTTLGELDFVFEHLPTETVYHLELAVKFYLCFGNGTEQHHFLGPNAKDRLDIKVKRVLSHQLPLIHHPKAQEFLEQQQVTSITSLAHLPGKLFYHFNENHQRVPTGINQHCKKGVWLFQHEWKAFIEKYGFTSFSIRPKLNWMCLNTVQSLVKSSAEIQEMIVSGEFDSPRMLSAYHHDFAPIFVVQNNWPNSPKSEKS